jgi:Na+/H+ antiporter NhaD/arsenite permease-like protein
MAAGDWPIIASTGIFLLTYAGILVQALHRTVVVLIGAVAMLCFGSWFSFYSPQQAVDATDSNTITLLLGMMIIVSLFRASGFFEFIAIRAARVARGRPWRLFILLGLATSVISMLLDNVTTIILMIPITMSIADILDIPVIPFLVGEAMLSNIGGVATLIGDPPNILIGSAAGLTFTDFVVHLTPIVIFVWGAVVAFLVISYRRSLSAPSHNVDRLQQMDARRALTDPRTARRMLVVLAATVLLFFVHDQIGLESGIVALLGAAAGLLAILPNLRTALQSVHWDVLLFFIGLFVIVGGLEASGALTLVASTLAGLSRYGVILTSLVILWAAALMSALVDNVPFTIAMLPILTGLAVHGVSAAPFWWALALGVGFGGNATPVGATANVIVISFSERARSPITTREWLRRGLPAALIACTAASILVVAAVAIGIF